MLDELKFVKGAVAAKDYVPALTHYRIADGRVSGFNGVLALSTPIDLDIVAMPKAAHFAKAIERLPDREGVVLNLTQAGRLAVKSGPFRAYVECWPEDEPYPGVEPKGEITPLPGGILPILARLAPFMGIDASRPWAMGILFTGQSAFVTNNVILLEQWLPIVFPSPINLPAVAVKEMLRIGKEPIAMQSEPNAITFHYENDAWLRTSLSSTEWPDLSAVLDRETTGQQRLADDFFDAVDRLDAFVEKGTGRIYITGNVLATSRDEGDGAQHEVPGFDGAGIFYLHQFKLLRGAAQTFDFTQWPKPCLFFGENLRGAMVGISG